MLSACTHTEKELLDMGSVQHEVDYFKNKGNWTNSKSYNNISKFEGNLLIIKSEKGKNVPDGVVDLYYKKAINVKKLNLKIIKESDHRMSEQKWRDEFNELISDWFLETL